MVRGNDPLWRFIEEIDNGNSLKCKFCGTKFSAVTSISRFKFHFARVEGRGVKICSQVTADVQLEAYQATQLSSGKQKMLSSSNNEVSNAASTSIQEQNNEVEDGVRGVQMEQERQPLLDDEFAWMDSLIEGEIELVEERRSSGILIVDAPDSRLIADQADEAFEVNKNNIVELSSGKEIMTEGLIQSVVERGCSSERPLHKRRRTRRYALPTMKPVGQEFEKNMNTVWSWLLNDEVSCIGIYGMGGVGKTTLATHIHNQLLEKRDIFHHVCWITVSQEFSIYTLQNLIAEAFDLHLSNEKDVRIRAGELLTELSVKRKYVLILDDLWNCFQLEQVGIPPRMDGCKLILTTRSLDVCRQMDCRRNIRVEPLSEVEAWNLFIDKLGHCVLLSPEEKQIAESIVKECAGLPLGILTMAGSMKRANDVYEWRNALRELKISEFKPSDMATELFQILKFSYLRLDDSALKDCFLYCALFPEDKKIRREDLIEYLIDEGIVEEMESRHAQFDKGQTMLNRLENASLLEGSTDDENYSYVKMHDLIRDMAVQIMKKSSRAMVQAGVQLTELPHENCWREDLIRVSLMDNRIEDIPSDCSPSCPNLSTLLLCRNYKLKVVEESFFQQLRRLEVLDLSDTDIEHLPNSISHLESLTALVLRWCAKLSYVPSLEKLVRLKKLDLSYTGLEKLPEGMAALKNLKYLNLDGSMVSDLPEGILPNLLQLQFLKLHQKFGVILTVRRQEISGLRKLETLECNFDDQRDLFLYKLRTLLTNSLRACNLTVGRPCPSLLTDLHYPILKSELTKEVWLYDLLIWKVEVEELPRFINKLVIVSCHNIRALFDVPLECRLKLGKFVCSHEDLEILYLDHLTILEVLIEVGSPAQKVGCRFFICLRQIVIHKCPSMTVLLPRWLFFRLYWLEVIVVEECYKMEEIVGTEEEEESGSSKIVHPVTGIKLRVLVLKDLPNLNSFYSGELSCSILKELTVIDCPNLKSMPFNLPRSLEKIEVHPETWWESVKWGHHNVMDDPVLQEDAIARSEAEVSCELP